MRQVPELQCWAQDSASATDRQPQPAESRAPEFIEWHKPVYIAKYGLGSYKENSATLLLARTKEISVRKALLPVLILAAIAACTGDEITANNSPQSAAEAFLLLIDQGNYQESWKESSTWLRNKVDADQWAEHAGSYRRPLGTIDHRKLKSVEFQASLEGMPDGDFAFVHFDSSLANNESASEMVGLMLDDDSTWRVIGYQTQ